MDVICKGAGPVVQALIEAEASGRIGAGRWERTETRAIQRDGDRDRAAGDQGGRRRAPRPEDVPGQVRPVDPRAAPPHRPGPVRSGDGAHVHGVSTRKVAAPGAAGGISGSEVSGICSNPDEEMAALCARRPGRTEFPHLFADATFLNGRVGGRACPPTTPPSIGSSPPSSSNNTTNGPSPSAATSPRRPWPASARTHRRCPPPRRTATNPQADHSTIGPGPRSLLHHDTGRHLQLCRIQPVGRPDRDGPSGLSTGQFPQLRGLGPLTVSEVNEHRTETPTGADLGLNATGCVRASQRSSTRRRPLSMSATATGWSARSSLVQPTDAIATRFPTRAAPW